MNAVVTYHDARKAKQNADARRFDKAKGAAMAERAAQVSATLNENPHIGVLACADGYKYYAFLDGVLHTAARPETLVRRAEKAGKVGA